ncbi:MAG: RNA 2',3'-cyclic phosphodiesterase [Desulfurivibrionaceae bacterium]
MRLFIAIDPPSEQRERIGSLHAGLPGVRWTAPEQIHLTLRFIGETDEMLFRQISANLATIRTEPLNLKIRGIGQFPPRRPARILWLGLAPNEQLLQLRNRIETTLVQSGLESEDQQFAPHITIARFRKAPPIKALAAFMDANRQFELPSFAVGEFHLYSSTITSAGAVHRREVSYPIPGPCQRLAEGGAPA